MTVGKLTIGRSIKLEMTINGPAARVTAWPIGPLWITWKHA